MHGEQHGTKVGSRIVGAVAQASRQAGYSAVQLGVLENNPKALAFWHRMEFTVVSKKQQGGGKPAIIVMAKDV